MSTITDLAWPMTIMLAWLAGEYIHRFIALPRISIYALVGFILSAFLPQTSSAGLLLLANVAFGLILFEAGYRINLRWLRANPWLCVTSVVESIITFCAVFMLVRWFSLPTSTAALLAALAMATSPASIVRVINEQRSSGQVTERLLHFSVLNSVLAVFAFKVIVGYVVFQTSGSFWQASYSSLIALSFSVLLGTFFGTALPALLRDVRRTGQDSTLAFSIAVICLVTLTHSLNLSPILATLTFGLVSRHRRIVLCSSQRGFGVLGDLLSVFLFVFIATTSEWKHVIAGLGLGLIIIIVRQLAKVLVVGAFSHVSGISWRKGFLTGLGMAPISVFVILILEQTRQLGINLIDQLSALAAIALIFEIFGPILTKQALKWAHECQEENPVKVHEDCPKETFAPKQEK